MTWNYRIIRKTKKNPIKGKYKGKKVTLHFYDLREVYYNKKGVPDKWTVEPLTLTGFDSVKDLRLTLIMMLADTLRAPVAEIKKRGKKEILVNRETRIGR